MAKQFFQTHCAMDEDDPALERRTLQCLFQTDRPLTHEEKMQLKHIPHMQKATHYKGSMVLSVQDSPTGDHFGIVLRPSQVKELREFVNGLDLEEDCTVQEATY